MARPTYRLLVADPDRLQLQLIDMLLAEGAYEATMVDTGREALEHLRSESPDLCLLALDLPDVAGDVICGKLRRVTRLARTPVMLISPSAGRFGLSDDARARARKAGADLVLPRPLGDKNLRDRVQALLDARDATPTREGLTTQVIEDALEHLDPDAVEPPPPDGAAHPAHGGPAPDAATEADVESLGRGIGAAFESVLRDPVVRTTGATESGDDAAPGDEASEALASLRQRVETLRLENAQLKRKLQEKSDALAKGMDPKVEQRLQELERRNQALLDALEAEKGKGRDGGGRGGGLFGRKK